MRRQQQAVEDVETLTAGLAIGPGLDNARHAAGDDGEAGDGATPSPVVDQRTAETLLADARPQLP